MERVKGWLGLLPMTILLTACGGTGYVAEPAPEGLPEALEAEVADLRSGSWTVLGFGQARAAAGETVLAGRDRADSRAREDLAERLASRQDYLRETLLEGLGSRKEGGLDKADIQAVVKRGGEVAVNQSRIVRRQRQADGTWHALARTDLEGPLREAAGSRDLSVPETRKLMEASRKALAGEEAAKKEGGTAKGGKVAEEAPGEDGGS